MTLRRIEIGLVSTDSTLADYYAAVFELEVLPAVEAGSGTVHRLQGPGALIKIMVPTEPPTPATPVTPFIATTGLRYLTLAVTDLDATLARAKAHNGTVQLGPLEISPGLRIALLQDPDGNTTELVHEPA
ncbi:VOC family protein [Yinghuangia sp. ASG 101]|uniref:VOC family protein n=1 Tax=Yinghuangia sp. ASG 101 TaxID=2896848 RepID=UPI001E6141FE|nr:VOC family protein [Yinghuangia sp. ASG 101]UGQ12675.1 VOC family protein [Yinghuangia sp. ASG 101]